MEYKIIMTDFSMPIMDGIEVTQHMRRHLNDQLGLEPERQPKIVGITGHAQESFKKAGYEAGMNDIIQKPIYKDTLKELLVKFKFIDKY